jgi:hypothetical protein
MDQPVWSLAVKRLERRFRRWRLLDSRCIYEVTGPRYALVCFATPVEASPVPFPIHPFGFFSPGTPSCQPACLQLLLAPACMQGLSLSLNVVQSAGGFSATAEFPKRPPRRTNPRSALHRLKPKLDGGFSLARTETHVTENSKAGSTFLPCRCCLLAAVASHPVCLPLSPARPCTDSDGQRGGPLPD